jgi:hypothetical protein
MSTPHFLSPPKIGQSESPKWISVYSLCFVLRCMSWIQVINESKLFLVYSFILTILICALGKSPLSWSFFKCVLDLLRVVNVSIHILHWYINPLCFDFVRTLRLHLWLNEAPQFNESFIIPFLLKYTWSPGRLHRDTYHVVIFSKTYA